MATGCYGQQGLYATACESSPHKTKIDQWINEGKSNAFISRQLENLGEKISDKSVAKYRSYREERLQKQLEADPLYQGQIQMMNQAMVDQVGKLKPINIMEHMQNVIEQCAEMLSIAKDEEIKIKNAQDIRFVAGTMLDAIKLYGDTVLKAQQFAKVEENPDLLRPNVTINVKDAIIGMLQEVGDDATRFKLIDKLRSGICGDDDTTTDSGSNDNTEF